MVDEFAASKSFSNMCTHICVFRLSTMDRSTEVRVLDRFTASELLISFSSPYLLFRMCLVLLACVSLRLFSRSKTVE